MTSLSCLIVRYDTLTGWYIGIKTIGTCYARLNEYVSLDRGQYLLPAKAPLDGAAWDIHGVQGEVIVVDNGVVPGRAGTIVAVIVTGHIRITREPVGVAIDTLPCAIGSFGPRLTVCSHF